MIAIIQGHLTGRRAWAAALIAALLLSLVGTPREATAANDGVTIFALDADREESIVVPDGRNWTILALSGVSGGNPESIRVTLEIITAQAFRLLVRLAEIPMASVDSDVSAAIGLERQVFDRGTGQPNQYHAEAPLPNIKLPPAAQFRVFDNVEQLSNLSYLIQEEEIGKAKD